MIVSSLASFFGVSGFCSDEGAFRIVLDQDQPDRSRIISGPGISKEIPVGFGKNGFLPEGSTFRGGYSLLGDFRVNAILSEARFEMTQELVRESGKSLDWLAENLFSNMSSIDFDGDGEGGEYGKAFVGLEPMNSKAKQPFHFGEYKGVFRWYSYAIHGTQDESRIGKCVTGGCINVGAKDLAQYVEKVRLGDLVSVEG